MKTAYRLPVFFVIVIVTALFSGCFGPDMDTPMKASTLDEYCDSMLKIGKALSPEDQQRFYEALDKVAIGPELRWDSSNFLPTRKNC